MAEVTARLSEEQVRERLRICEDTEIVNEIYNFGQTLMKESIDNVRVIESKATFIAAYGSAIVTLLVSSSSAWARLGNQWTLWVGLFAGICGFICTVFSVRAMSLKQFNCISQDEWLKAECLSGRSETLKRYHVLTMWGTIDSHDKVQAEKAGQLQRAQSWLKGAVIFLVYLLLHIAFVQTFSHNLWVALGQLSKEHHLGIPGGQNFLSSPTTLGGLCSALILGSTLIWIARSSRLSRLYRLSRIDAVRHGTSLL